MKILAINASHRGRKGFTQVLIDKLFAGAMKAGADCASVVLAELKIKGLSRLRAGGERDGCLTAHQPVNFAGGQPKLATGSLHRSTEKVGTV